MSKQCPGKDYFQQGEINYFLGRDAKAFDLFQKSAEQKCTLAYVRLARMHANGRDGGKISNEKSNEWQEKIKQNIRQELQAPAESGNPEAQYILGVCYENGYGVDKDLKQAVTLYEKAAAQNNSIGKIHLAYYYQEQKDMKQAIAWYQKAAEQGFADAQYALGYCHHTGSDVPKDEKQAAGYYQKAAEQGHATAQCCLAMCYANGTGVMKNEKQAIAYYQRAAEQGHATAQFYLGRRYAQGNGVGKSEKKALAWVKKAAEQGLADAQFYFGCCHSTAPFLVPLGIDMSKYRNEREASIWVLKAAEQGHAMAQFHLIDRPDLFPGANFQDKLGIPKDRHGREAFLWYQQAASGDSKLNIGVAQFELACRYELGRGVETDRQQAMLWFKKALQNGIGEAEGRIKILSSSVVCESKEEADALVQEYLNPIKPATAAAASSSSASSTKDPLIKDQPKTGYSVSMFSIPVSKPQEKDDSLCSSCQLL